MHVLNLRVTYSTMYLCSHFNSYICFHVFASHNFTIRIYVEGTGPTVYHRDEETNRIRVDKKQYINSKIINNNQLKSTIFI